MLEVAGKCKIGAILALKKFTLNIKKGNDSLLEEMELGKRPF